VKTSPYIRSEDEHSKFLLLPDGVDYKVSIFENLPEGVWEDVTPTIDKNLFPSIADRFFCRELEAHDI
jgi:hypothetical protein